MMGGEDESLTVEKNMLRLINLSISKLRLRYFLCFSPDFAVTSFHFLFSLCVDRGMRDEKSYR